MLLGISTTKLLRGEQMNDSEHIRKAVELADGWTMASSSVVQPPTKHLAMSIHNPSTWILDALAAQLVRQVDALDSNLIAFGSASTGQAMVYRDALAGDVVIVDEGDRTMNTIKAIIESKALESR